MVKRFMIFLFLLTLGGQSLAITRAPCGDHLSTAPEASHMDHAGHKSMPADSHTEQRTDNCCDEQGCAVDQCSPQFFVSAAVATTNVTNISLLDAEYSFPVHSPDLLSPSRPPIYR